MYLIPQLGYPLPAMSLSEEACHTIQSPTLMALLPKLHLNRHMARSTVFGPTRFGGLAIHSLYSIQSLGQLTLFVGHSQARDKTSTLLCISLSYLQLVVGSSTSVLALSFQTHSVWLESIWLVSFWKFLSRVNLLVCLQHQWLPVLACYGDIALMDHFVCQGYKALQLRQLNRCHLYLQVLTLADIVSADGTCIFPDIFAGVPLEDRRSSLQWPNQQQPHAKDWMVWSSALWSFQPRNKLLTPLGAWLVNSYHQSWT
jgi:hypothetical protein